MHTTSAAIHLYFTSACSNSGVIIQACCIDHTVSDDVQFPVSVPDFCLVQTFCGSLTYLASHFLLIAVQSRQVLLLWFVRPCGSRASSVGPGWRWLDSGRLCVRMVVITWIRAVIRGHHGTSNCSNCMVTQSRM